jgi:hypothetical protein
MRATHSIRNEAVDLRTESGRAPVRSGMWLIVGYLGASAVMLGLLSLFHGQGNPLPALGYVVAGGALAAYSWRSAHRAADGIRTDAPSAGQARVAATRSASGLTTLVGAPEA